MIALKSITIAIPAAILSFDPIGERIVFFALILAALNQIWRQVIKPIVNGCRKMAATYELAAEHLPTVVSEVAAMRRDLDALKTAGDLVDIVRDVHTEEAREAIRRGLPYDPFAD